MGIYHKHTLDAAPSPLPPAFTQFLTGNTAPKPQLRVQRYSTTAVPILLLTGEKVSSMI